MRIQELEKELNISRSNIRFYEKEGLINPPRKENGYREYSEEDIAKLKKIIIFRKLGITVADIKSIFDGTLSLQTAIDNNIDRLHKEIEELNGAIEVCEQIKEETCEEKDFPQDHFWNIINNRENQGEKFNEIIKDYLEIELDILKRIFGLKHTKRKLSIKQIILIALAMCTIRGIMCHFVWKSATFIEGFSYPLIIFALVSIVIAPICYFAHKNPKIATILIYIIFIFAALLFGGIAIIFIIAFFNMIFG